MAELPHCSECSERFSQIGYNPASRTVEFRCPNGHTLVERAATAHEFDQLKARYWPSVKAVQYQGGPLDGQIDADPLVDFGDQISLPTPKGQSIYRFESEGDVMKIYSYQGPDERPPSDPA